MRGFFGRNELKSVGFETKGLSCVACGLYKSANSPVMKPYGRFRKKIMVIGDYPSEEDDRHEKPWRGALGRKLRRKFRELGVDLFGDCINLFALQCHPKSGTPTDHEIACCRQKVFAAIRKYKPKVIIPLGTMAINSILGSRWKRNFGGITKWRGWAIPDHEVGAWVCPTFNPQFIERQREENEVGVLWTRDLKQAFSKTGVPLPKAISEQSIVVTEDIEDVLKKMNSTKSPYIAFDIETTGLKPYDKEVHRIISISFCDNPDGAYAIKFPTKKRHLRLLKKLLRNPKIGKIAANMKFEDTWMNVQHGINVRPWKFDTMQAAHILDNRPGITSLAFQAFVQFGVLGFDEDIAPYIRSKGSHAVNRIETLIQSRAGLRNLLVYNGMDSLIEFRLAELQMGQLWGGGLKTNAN